MTDFGDIELAGLTDAELEELSEFIDPDVSLWAFGSLVFSVATYWMRFDSLTKFSSRYCLINGYLL